jgi:hypothetical protein
MTAAVMTRDEREGLQRLIRHRRPEERRQAAQRGIAGRLREPDGASLQLRPGRMACWD